MSLLFWLFDWCSADYSFWTVLIDLIVDSKEINKKLQEGQHFYNPKKKTVNKLGQNYYSKLKLLLTLKIKSIYLPLLKMVKKITLYVLRIEICLSPREKILTHNLLHTLMNYQENPGVNLNLKHTNSMMWVKTIIQKIYKNTGTQP